jgi:hypothetical protein
MLQLLGASQGSESLPANRKGDSSRPKAGKQSCEGTEIAYGRSYAKISDKT